MALPSLLTDDDINKFRTRVCERFQLSGSCEFGKKCQFSHDPSNRRRSPGSFQYSYTLCQSVKGKLNTGFSYSGYSVPGSACRKGKFCNFAHCLDEILYHPLVYKTLLCPKDTCTEYYCPYGHHPLELRVPPHDYRQFSSLLNHASIDQEGLAPILSESTRSSVLSHSLANNLNGRYSTSGSLLSFCGITGNSLNNNNNNSDIISPINNNNNNPVTEFPMHRERVSNDQFRNYTRTILDPRNSTHDTLMNNYVPLLYEKINANNGREEPNNKNINQNINQNQNQNQNPDLACLRKFLESISSGISSDDKLPMAPELYLQYHNQIKTRSDYDYDHGTDQNNNNIKSKNQNYTFFEGSSSRLNVNGIDSKMEYHDPRNYAINHGTDSCGSWYPARHTEEVNAYVSLFNRSRENNMNNGRTIS